MKKFLAFSVGLLFSSSLLGQNLNKLTPQVRDSLLIYMAKESVLQYGPGFYREDYPPIVERKIVEKSNSEVRASHLSEYPGRAFFTVEYQYDREKESMHWHYAAKSFFWADNGTLFSIIFGNG